jgi:hypothetical protein
MRLIADRREARYTFKLLPPGNVFVVLPGKADYRPTDGAYTFAPP